MFHQQQVAGVRQYGEFGGGQRPVERQRVVERDQVVVAGQDEGPGRHRAQVVRAQARLGSGRVHDLADDDREVVTAVG